MRKIQNKKHRANMNLGELILAVSSCSKNKRETVAAVADLIESGRVRFRSGGRVVRAHVC
jgi:hypothetical protein